MDQHRLEKSNKLRNMGLNPYVNSHIIESPISDIVSVYGNADATLPEETEFAAAGRIMGKREFGKTCFLSIKDRTGKIQVYIKKGLITDDEFSVFSLSDVGDFVGVKGTLFRTKTGELTIRAKSYRLLTKALRDLPEKFHGLKDVEIRYRQRYLDLIMNDDAKEVFLKRSRIIHEIRSFFTDKGFIEAETPMMHSIIGGAAAKPFITHHNALDMQLYLRIAPELYLKRLVVGGIERVFELNRNFRNEGVDTKHNPEFTMIEWYMAYADYHTLMDMIEELISDLAIKINGTANIEFGDCKIDMTRPWKRITMEDSLGEFANVSKDMINTREKAASLAAKHGIKVEESWGKGKIIQELFDILVEDKLINPTFITDYPKEISPLSKSKENDPELTDRFELFVAGMELANGFNELNDPIDQKERFQKQVDSRNAGDEEACMMDDDYIRALEYGLPPTAGAGMGVDRLVMLLTNQISIREVLLFPYMRQEEQGENQA
ncbi:MAG: lysine--tRNA ligase [Deferribacterales bacterium]|nr:lysine--tRNA ligase [Deferribacterales bacterium]